ncbi:MAG: hypothetical protein NZM26_00455 [Patescibacteria group bacterium]|nr:hypothetical protein [Patescibacteria group bacterium]
MIPVWRKNYQRYRSYFSHIISQYKNRDDLINYLEIILSLIAISIFSLFALKPTLTTITQLIKEIDTNTQIINTMDKKIQSITQAQILYDREMSKIKLVFESVPTGAYPETIIRQIEGLSAKHNVAISNISIERSLILGTNNQSTESKADEINLPENSSKNVYYLETTVVAKVPLNEYLSIQNFLSDLEKQRLPLIITQINTASVKDKENKNLMLNIKLYLPYTKNDNLPKKIN